MEKTPVKSKVFVGTISHSFPGLEITIKNLGSFKMHSSFLGLSKHVREFIRNNTDYRGPFRVKLVYVLEVK